MSGASIAAEVAVALTEVASDVGDGEFVATLTRTNSAPVNPWDTDSSTTETFDIPALVQMYPRDMIDGTLIRAEDRKVMLAANGEKPTTADTLTISGADYEIMKVDETAPSGVPLYYEVQARK